MSPTSPLRHESHEGTISPKTARLVRLYRDELELRFSPRTVRGYSDYVDDFAHFLGGRGVEPAHAKTEDLQAYQRDLFTRRTRPTAGAEGKAYSLGYQAGHITAVKSFYRFLYKRLLILRDPAAPLELPRLDNRLPRTILTRAGGPPRARRRARALGGRAARPRLAGDALRDRHPLRRAGEARAFTTSTPASACCVSSRARGARIETSRSRARPVTRSMTTS